jgi:hypothetical protein
MKINLGPYPTQHLQSKLLDTYTKDYFASPKNLFEKFLDKTDDVLQTVLNATINPLLARRKKKLKVHIDDYDVWSAHHTLALVIHPVLVRLKEKKHGAPCTDDSDVPEHLRSTTFTPKERSYDVDDGHFERWDWIMDEMIWTFSQEMDADADEQFFMGENYDKEKAIAWETRKANGLRLFGKYYSNLWD